MMFMLVAADKERRLRRYWLGGLTTIMEQHDTSSCFSKGRKVIVDENYELIVWRINGLKVLLFGSFSCWWFGFVFGSCSSEFCLFVCLFLCVL